MVITKPKTAVVTCPTCKTKTLTRNHYFTGKLMVERDFTDEQEYFMEHNRLHNQRLHGTGVVCGLKIIEHENPVCRDRYVILQPGSAIDCCGNHILVVEPEVIDLHAFPAVQELLESENRRDHTLQFCIKYVECPTEEIPVLYDECGCDDTQCAPNRILESYCLDVLIDPPETPEPILSPQFNWNCTINIANAARVVIHEPSQRLWILTGDESGTIYQVSTDNLAVETAVSVGGKGFAMEVSSDGQQLYAVVRPDGKDLMVLRTYDISSSNTITAISPSGSIQGSEASTSVFLEVSPNGHLYIVLGDNGVVHVWEPKVLPDPPDHIGGPLNLTSPLFGLAFSGDGTTGYIPGGGSDIHVIDLNPLSVSQPPISLPGVAASDLDVITSTGPDRLAIIDQDNTSLHVLDPASPSVVKSIQLDHQPIDVTVAEGGHWAYVLERRTDHDYVQVVDLHRLWLEKPESLSSPIKVGPNSQHLLLSNSGKTLFVPFFGDLDNDNTGGVAVIHITEQNCEEILCNLNVCPTCGHSDCLVLATVEGWRPGRKLQDIIDPPSDPIADAAADIARIDNRKGRKLLPSTQAIAEALKCVMENCCNGGGGGEPGPPGKDGLPGESITGPMGPPGPGLEKGLTQIDALSWVHNTGGNPLATIVVGKVEARGIVVRFTNDVTVDFDAEHVFQVLIQHEVIEGDLSLSCWCALTGGKILPVLVSPLVNGVITKATVASTPDAHGAAYVFENSVIDNLIRQNKELWVRLRGDFITDVTGKAVDVEFVRGILPTGDRPATPPGSDFGIQGGLFESWFQPAKDASPTRVNLNTASATELTTLPGIGTALAQRIINRRDSSPFNTVEDLVKIQGISADLINDIRHRITIE